MEQSRYHRYRGFILVLLVAMIGISPRPDRTKSILNSASAENLSQQIALDVQTALETLGNTTTLHDWQSSGFTPNDVLKNVFALHRRRARRALCDALGGLSPADLSHFELALQSAIRTRDPARKLACAPKLLDRIQRYWIAQTATVDVARLSGGDTASPDSGVKKLAPSSGEITPKDLESGEFALVFEGPLGPMTTREVLGTLESRGVKAIFLMPGASAREFPGLVRDMARAGDTVGSQGVDSADFTTMDLDDADEDISEGLQAVSAASGSPSLLFGFPGEASSEAAENLVRAKGLKVVRGDLELQDWKVFDASDLIRIAQHLIRHRSKGILVLHSDFHQTSIALPAILDELAASHRKVVTFRPE